MLQVEAYLILPSDPARDLSPPHGINPNPSHKIVTLTGAEAFAKIAPRGAQPTTRIPNINAQSLGKC